MIRRGPAWTIFLITAGLLGMFFLWPLVVILVGGFFEGGRFTGKYLAGVFANPIYLEGLRNSVMIAVATTSLVTLLAVPLAWVTTQFDFGGKRILSGLILVPMILPPFVGAIGLQQILGRFGALNALFGLGPVDWLGQGRFFGVVLLQALGLYPIMYLNVAAALANVDPAMEEAAANLGSGTARTFWRITLPLIMPGLFAGGTIVFIWSFTELGTPLIMNFTRCTPVQVFDGLKEIGTNPFPFALVAVMLGVSVVLYTMSKWVFGGQGYAMQGKAALAATARPLRGGKAWLAALPMVTVAGLALLPHAGVILTSISQPGSWYQSVLPSAFTGANFQEALGHSLTVGSIRNSLLYSVLAVTVNLGLGIMIAFVLVRSDLPGRGFLDGLAMLPLAVPGLVLAFGFLAISSQLSNQGWVKGSPFWQALVDIRSNPTLFLVIAYAVRRLPYMVRAAVAGLQQTSVTLEEAAANLGASAWTTVRRITLPLILANLIAGALLSFSFSMLEVSDSLMLAQRQDFYPITKTIYELFQVIGTGKYLAAALGVWAMVFLGMTVLGASRLLGKKMGQLFRV
jgi:iron(III) transport system permease protein